MQLQDFLDHVNGGSTIEGGSGVHAFTHGVGAGAVVTKDVPANAVVAGVPAKLIRMTGFHASPQ